MATEEEDFEYNDDEIENSGVFRWLQAAVVLFALGGFFGLAWYAYKSGEGVDDKDVELVKVENEPVKEAPANPGGMQIPNQDKTVYGLINGNKQEKPVVERIVPSTEEPEHDNETGTWTNGKGKTADAKPVQPADAPPIKEVAANDTTKKFQQFTPTKAKPTVAAAASTPSVAIEQASAPVAAPVQTPAVTEVKPVIVADNTSPIQTPVAAPQKVVPAVPVAETKPAPEAAASNASLPKVRIQLGALKSEAEAESTWTKLSGKFSDSLGGKQHYIVHVTVNGNNFYRLQAAPFNSPQEANETCATLASSGQACILAKGK